MNRIILASQSPRRKELLQEIVSHFECINPDEEKKINKEKFSYQLIEDIALEKARSVYKKISDNEAVIISADTVVILEDEILTKPKDIEDAINTLKKLSDKTHKVVTAHAIKKGAYEKVISVTTEVTFNNLSDSDIIKYVKDKQPLDKAGAYGIQELPENFVKEIKGSLNNVIGFCVETVKDYLINLGVHKRNKSRMHQPQ